MTEPRVCITGVGVVSPVGSSAAEVWQRLNAASPWLSSYDHGRFAPYGYHPEAAFDAATQIAARTQVRGMGRAQLNATYAAGAALESAELKGKAELLEKTDLFVACSPGDNDLELDEAILRDGCESAAFDARLNERLMGYRPSLYLNQLPNLFAANISICHGVLGGSLTFIGDEVAGMNALFTAYRRIRAGQSDITLVGGAGEGGRKHYLESYAGQEELLEGEFVEIWDRRDDKTCFGNAAGFLVLESEPHARQRGAEIKAFLGGLEVSYTARAKSSATQRTAGLLRELERAPHAVAQVIACSNLRPAMLAEEEQFWKARADGYQNLCNVTGGLLEASLPVSVALAVLCIQNGITLPPLSTRHAFAERRDAPGQLLASCWGRLRGEAVALVEG